MDLSRIKEEAASAAAELCETAKLREGDIFVVGCSSSEVLGEKIGTHTSLDVAEAIYEGINEVLAPRGIFLAGQCCEHLNRALVLENEALRAYRLRQVNAIPQPNHAGGAFGTVCYKRMKDAVLAESLMAEARAGIDIGATLIGMHMKAYQRLEYGERDIRNCSMRIGLAVCAVLGIDPIILVFGGEFKAMAVFRTE